MSTPHHLTDCATRWQLAATRRVVLAIVLSVVAATLVDARATPAGARIRDYGRDGGSFQGVPLRTRGYLDDECVRHVGLPCYTSSIASFGDFTVVKRLRPEASAQSIAMWYLAVARGDTPVPGEPGSGYTKVDWEVGPGPDTPRASAGSEPPGEPEDECDPALPGYVNPLRWRIDIVVDKATLLEVKRWDGDATVGRVANQLGCYVTITRGLGVGMEPNDELNLAGWAVPYEDQMGGDWCVWAGEVDGHIYFAPESQIDPNAPNAVAACDDDDDDELDIAKVLVASALAVDAVIVAEDDRRGAKKRIGPALGPAYRELPSGGATSYAVAALQDPDTDRLLRLDFGDGTSESTVVPRGSGVTTATFDKVFGPQPARYFQTLSVVPSPLAHAAAAGPATSAALIATGVTDVTPPCTVLPAKCKANSDFDGDGRTDRAIFRPGNGFWYVHSDSASQFGTSGDVAVPADYDGDGDADIAVFRPRLNGLWFVRGGPITQFGTNGDVPVPADYDGDGDADLAVFRPSSGHWFVDGGPVTQFGTSGDIPVPADYDGDGAADLAVFRPSSGHWFVQGGTVTQFGTSGDVPVRGDYDGDGRYDIAVYRPSTGTWFVQNQFARAWGGAPDDVAVPGDYDGDGLTDVAVYRPSVGTWFTNGSSGPVATRWGGVSGDIPVPRPLSPLSLRITLTWDLDDTDVDLRVTDSQGNESWFENRCGVPRGCLQVDHITGYGPEVFDLYELTPGMTYTIRVHYYEDNLNGPTTVKVVAQQGQRLFQANTATLRKGESLILTGLPHPLATVLASEAPVQMLTEGPRK